LFFTDIDQKKQVVEGLILFHGDCKVKWGAKPIIFAR